jgi:hypothetical protein
MPQYRIVFTIVPPSTTGQAPVMSLPASLANSSTGPASSSRLPKRPNAVRSANFWRVSSVKFVSVSSVKKGPGAMQLTVMPNWPRSMAHARARPKRALLVAE